MAIGSNVARLGAGGFMALALGGCATGSRLQGDPQVGVTVGQILKTIRCEFVAYVNSPTGRSRFAAVKPWVIQGKLVVSVLTNTNVAAGGTVKAYTGGVPFSIGLDGSVDSKDTSSLTVDFSLDPGKTRPKDCEGAALKPGFGLAKWLEAVEDAKTGTDGLTLKDKALTFGLNFGVTSSFGINGSFGVQPVALTASALRKRDDVQTLTIAIQPAPEQQVILVRNVGLRPPKPPAGPDANTLNVQPSQQPQERPLRPVRVRVRPNLEPLLLQKQRELLGD